ncbi:uncharacterized protein LOC116570582 isoform X2 [Mustela erminea]|uniref:uncharacterized protein LOC116570582 isoform X2 n=1 Tax=Mustela erminea TaxID=36723 RepID=UPI001386AF05|nr:uncharacterized protein LOC116570582 isoform X2 [Mustela erminea]
MVLLKKRVTETGNVGSSRRRPERTDRLLPSTQAAGSSRPHGPRLAPSSWGDAGAPHTLFRLRGYLAGLPDSLINQRGHNKKPLEAASGHRGTGEGGDTSVWVDGTGAWRLSFLIWEAELWCIPAARGPAGTQFQREELSGCSVVTGLQRQKGAEPAGGRGCPVPHARDLWLSGRLTDRGARLRGQACPQLSPGPGGEQEVTLGQATGRPLPWGWVRLFWKYKQAPDRCR